MNDSDLLGLPDITQKLALRLFEFGLDRPRVHGFFVMLGLYAGAPNEKERLNALFYTLNQFLPVDRSKNIEDVIGHIYDGYDRQINEFCYRSGIKIDFREIQIPWCAETLSVVYPRDEGLLNSAIFSINRLVDSSRLYDSFLNTLGKPTLARDATLLEAFTCGVFQIQLHGQSDIKGAKQIAALINQMLPIFLGGCFRAVIHGDVEYFMGLTGEQVALLDLMQPMELTYSREMWVFQSCLLYHNQQKIRGLENLTCEEWHRWVLNRALGFSAEYPEQLSPFSKSGMTLADLPKWGLDIGNFGLCDEFIQSIWGFSSAVSPRHAEKFEYRALIVHTVYSSLTAFREVMH